MKVVAIEIPPETFIPNRSLLKEFLGEALAKPRWSLAIVCRGGWTILAAALGSVQHPRCALRTHKALSRHSR
jgi:hypothetical protein